MDGGPRREDAETVAREAFGNRETETSARSGDDDIIHGGRAFRHP